MSSVGAAGIPLKDKDKVFNPRKKKGSIKDGAQEALRRLFSRKMTIIPTKDT